MSGLPMSRLSHCMLFLVRSAIVIAVLPAAADAFDSIVLFGDSLSDDCSHGASSVVDDALQTTQPYPGMPYYKGCVFSNGPVYIDVAAGLLNISLEDYAVGGATSGAALGSLGIPVGFANRTTATTVDVPSTLEQVETYLDTHNGMLSSTALYSVYIGGNDYIDTLAGAGNATVEDVLMLTEAAFDLLYDAGARLFLTQTLPSVGDTPAVGSRGAQAAALGDRLTDAHNAGLNGTLANFAQEHPEASVMLFDFYTLEQGIRNNATMYNITDLNNPCYNGRVAGKTLTPISTTPTVCSNPDNHAFWDAIHPTAVVHNLWGEALAKQLQPFISTGFGNSSSPFSFANEVFLVQSNQLKLFQ